MASYYCYVFLDSTKLYCLNHCLSSSVLFFLHLMIPWFFSNPGNPFSCGVTLAKLAAVTMDEQGNETFDTSGALDKLRKVCSMVVLYVCFSKIVLGWLLIPFICDVAYVDGF